MSKEIFNALELLEKEKGIPKDYMLEKISQALLTAYKEITTAHQLSLAIGKEGQNARLAAKLTGYKIDIKPESEA